MIHDSQEDVSEARTPTPAQAESIALLELNPDGRRSPRLTLAQWRHVDRVVVALVRRDELIRAAAAIPAPRPPHPRFLEARKPSSPGSS